MFIAFDGVPVFRGGDAWIAGEEVASRGAYEGGRWAPFEDDGTPFPLTFWPPAAAF